VAALNLSDQPLPMKPNYCTCFAQTYSGTRKPRHVTLHGKWGSWTQSWLYCKNKS